MAGKSLIDDSMSGIGNKGGGGGGGGGKGKSGGSNDKIKMIVAVVGLVAGLCLIGYSQGMFDSILKSKPKDVTKTFTPEQQETYKKAQQEKERLDREVPPSGS